MVPEGLPAEELIFWDAYPQLVPLYDALRQALYARFPDLSVKVGKTQISFYGRHMFAAVSAPVRRKKGWPKEFILLTLGMPRRLSSPRVIAVTEPYPGRWTHHLLLQSAEAPDEELLDWLEEAYAFAQTKR